MKCPKCKNKLRKGAKFCPACGARVEKKRGLRLTSILLVIVLLLSIVAIGWSGGILFAKHFGGSNNIFSSRSRKDDSLEQSTITLFSDIKDVIVKKEVNVTFSAKISLDEQPDEIPIICENEIIGIMCDNGQNDDAVKKDGIYTGIVKLYSETETYREYYAQVGESYSNPVSIFFYSELTENDVDNLNKVNNRLNEIQAQYLDENGFVSKEKIPSMFDVFCEELELYVTSGVVESFRTNQDNIYIKFSSGIPFMFIPNQKDTLSSGNTGEIITLEPASSTFGVWSTYNIFIELDKKYNNLEYQGGYDISSCANYIANAFDQYNYSSHLQDSNVTIDAIQSYGSGKLVNGILMWEGHGAYDESIGSVLVTGEEAWLWKNIAKYSADLKDERIVTTGGLQTLGTNFINCSYAITAKYIDTYFYENSLQNCFVYLGACSSGIDSRLADSFINKGASVVFASVGVIGMEFEILTRTTILYNMCKEKENGQLHSAEEALEIAWATIGEYDPANEGTYVTCFGDSETFRFSVDEGHPLYNDAYETYLAAANKTTESGGWSEYLTLTANMAITDGSAKTKTKVTLTSNADVSNYSESDPSQIRMSGSAEMTVMGQTYAWDMEYENGTAHYQYTKPNQTSADMKIDPSFFNFGTMTSDMMSNAKISGNKITFTVSGEKIAEVGIAAVNQMSGVDDLEYGDVDVTVTFSDDGKIDNIAMVFHASLEYQGYDADVDYNIDYRFSDSSNTSSSPLFSGVPIVSGIYAQEGSNYNTLTIHETDGRTLEFTAFWYRIADFYHAIATVSDNTASFEYIGPDVNWQATGTLHSPSEDTIILTISDSTNENISTGEYHYSLIGRIFTDSELKEISAALNVPADLDTQITQGEPAYWEGGGIYRTPIEIYYNGELIAGASVNSLTGELAGNIYVYSAPDTSGDSVNIASTFGFNKAWDIHDRSGTEHFVTSLVFSEDGTFCCAVGWYLSEWYVAFTGTYQVNGDEIILNYMLDGDEKMSSYQVKWDDQILRQTSEENLVIAHQIGSEYPFEENPWYTTEQLKDQVDTFMRYNG